MSRRWNPNRFNAGVGWSINTFVCRQKFIEEVSFLSIHDGAVFRKSVPAFCRGYLVLLLFMASEHARMNRVFVSLIISLPVLFYQAVLHGFIGHPLCASWIYVETPACLLLAATNWPRESRKPITAIALKKIVGWWCSVANNSHVAWQKHGMVVFDIKKMIPFGGLHRESSSFCSNQWKITQRDVIAFFADCEWKCMCGVNVFV